MYPEGSNIQFLQTMQAHLEAAAEELVQEKTSLGNNQNTREVLGMHHGKESLPLSL